MIWCMANLLNRGQKQGSRQKTETSQAEKSPDETMTRTLQVVWKRIWRRYCSAVGQIESQQVDHLAEFPVLGRFAAMG